MMNCKPCEENADAVNPEIGVAVVICGRHDPAEAECAQCSVECDSLPEIWQDPNGIRRQING